jgi:V/A-type H+-transporting ATPase subunit D
MSARERVPSTRANWLRVRRELARVERGAALTRRKREALVAELFRSARPALDARRRLAEASTQASEALLAALAEHGMTGLASMSWNAADPLVEVRPASVWGIPLSEIVSRPPLQRTCDARGNAPALAGVSTSLAALRYERLAELLIDAGSAEQRLDRLSSAVAAATRRLRVLEQDLAPRLAAQVATVRRDLDEREREERVRLRRVAAARQRNRAASA